MSNLPLDLILIRHGESERNLIAKDNEIEFDEKEYKSIHSSKFRLTEEGKKQSIVTGKYIKEHISSNFDKYYTSDYIRTKETAGLLNLENALWDCEFLIRERDNGVLSGLSNIEKELLYHDEILRRNKNLFYFAPIGGESIANVCSGSWPQHSFQLCSRCFSVPLRISFETAVRPAVRASAGAA